MRSATKNNKLTNATIMIVDDEPINIEVVQAFLEEHDYKNFVTIEDSTQVMGQLEEARPDLILLDLMMPEVSGFDILAAVRAHPQFQYLPIIILTASCDTGNMLKALEMGATDFLAKPLDQSELALRVRNTLYAKAYQDQLAYYDPLTKLPNRQLFIEDLKWALSSAERHQEQLALLSIEIDKLDQINDTLGINTGDEILCIASQRIKKVIRASDVFNGIEEFEDAEMKLFRMDGNVFSLILTRIRTPDSPAQVSKRILQELAAPTLVDNKDLYVTASIGIATYPSEATDKSTLLRLALSAKDFAKRKGGNNFQFSSTEINTTYQRRLALESTLRKALENEDFTLFYQPKVDTSTGHIVGAEALIRLRHNGKIVSPGAFIPLAEETGLIIPIGKWCLIEACRQLEKWQQSGHDYLGMSVNISAKQFADEEFMAEIAPIVRDSGINPSSLTLELTESLLIDNIEEKIVILSSLKELGIKLSIDDFGTGYSSLNYLRKLPLDELKIDRSFVMEIATHSNSRAIISTIIYLAQELGLLTVAEGIEQEMELDFIRNLNCRQYQGFYFSRPVPHQEFSKLLLNKAAI